MLPNEDKMSDNSESGSEDAKYDDNDKDGNSNDICRDFLRNVCKRGKRCKYRHPRTDEVKHLGKRQEYTFCHDYQNTGCRRANCKFLHCTREEEEYFRHTGQMPVRLQQAAALGIGIGTPNEHSVKGEIPICKDYLKGDCRRGSKCKFRHLTASECEFQIRKAEQFDSFRDGFDRDRFDRFEFEHDAKRRRLDRDFDGFSSFERKPLSFQLLEDENTMLRRKVEELKKQVADLTATNEVLLEQNARYRVSKSNVLHTLNTGAVPPTVQATSLNHLNTTLAQQIALNSDLVSQQALQQRIVRELAAPQQAPGNINATVTMTPQNIVPVSLPQNVNLQQCAVTQSLQKNLAATNAPLVSYPIVSQTMRSAGVPSSLAH